MNTGGFNCNSSYTSSLHTFKVFRVTTRFKKFSRGITRFVRKTIMKRKHRNNWLNMSYVIKQWIIIYLKQRQFVRFIQVFGMFQTTSFSITAIFFNKQFNAININSGLMIASCSRSVLNNFSFFSQKHFISPIPNTPSTILASDSLISVSKENDVNPGLILYDKLLYPFNLITTNTYKELTTIGLSNELFRLVLNSIVIFYKILIKLILLTLFKKY
jgi:hypothetical protein